MSYCGEEQARETQRKAGGQLLDMLHEERNHIYTAHSISLTD